MNRQTNTTRPALALGQKTGIHEYTQSFSSLF